MPHPFPWLKGGQSKQSEELIDDYSLDFQTALFNEPIFDSFEWKNVVDAAIEQACTITVYDEVCLGPCACRFNEVILHRVTEDEVQVAIELVVVGFRQLSIAVGPALGDVLRRVDAIA